MAGTFSLSESTIDPPPRPLTGALSSFFTPQTGIVYGGDIQSIGIDH